MKIRRPSPALLVAFIALSVALSGAAIALPGKSTVQRNDLKKNAVTGAAVKDGALTGADINESGLGQVPSAVSADTATTATTATTAGTSAETDRLLHWSTGQFAEGGTRPVLTLGGITLTASCDDNGANSTILRYVVSGPGDAFAEGQNTDALPGELPETINQDASGTGLDLLNAEEGGFLLGNGAGLRMSGQLGGLVNGAGGVAGICEAWGSATVDS